VNFKFTDFFCFIPAIRQDIDSLDPFLLNLFCRRIFVSLYRFTLSSLFLTIALSPTQALAATPAPISLQNLVAPEVPGLLDGNSPIITDKDSAIALGKALFWDTNVGSDGMACGSCHFHAGADRRTKNQLSPGGKSTAFEDQVFSLSSQNTEMGPNHTLTKADFPFHKKQDPFNINSATAYDTDDVSSSAGTFSGDYVSSSAFKQSVDECDRSADPIFHVNGTGTRRVEPRNTPTVINSIFNHRSFWDGRANNVFNGSSPWGDRDKKAGVWVQVNRRTVAKQPLHLINSSLASLALAPPLSDTEMGCKNRSFPAIGRKLLMRQPLESQKVHWNDSVLGNLSHSTPGDLKNGLSTTYKTLIRKAFNKKYWSYTRRGKFGGPEGEIAYNQMEANFSMFFALSIQLYESTLISDQSRFDNSQRDANHTPIDLTASELRGLELFKNNECVNCHIGPNFSAASVAANATLNQVHPEAFGSFPDAISTTSNVVTRKLTQTHTAFTDTGFASTGVALEATDLGLGGLDDFKKPLSFSLQYLQLLVNNQNQVVDTEVNNVRSCDLEYPLAMGVEPPFNQPRLFLPPNVINQPQSTENCFLQADKYAFLPTPQAAEIELANPDSKKIATAVKGAFKIPSLHNIELTGPYMHNGSMATLKEVVEFYARGGNFHHDAKQTVLVFPLFELQESEQNRKDLVAFLKSLTDDRVRFEKAPFDHPEIKVPHGHVGDNFAVNDGNALSPDLAEDEFLVIEAVGAEGREQTNPLLPFDNYLAP